MSSLSEQNDFCNAVNAEDRDITDYTQNYIAPGFEEIQVSYRRKQVLHTIRKHKPRVILEIGCGMEPLFTYMEQAEYDLFVVIEPSELFYQNAVHLADNRAEILCIHDFFCEDVAEKFDSMNFKFDMVICSSLLHEMPAPEQILTAIRSVCSNKTIAHINVPNANSIHRIWAKYAGLIKDERNLSDRNKMLQQAQVFDLDSLSGLVQSVGFEIIEKGSYFLKPFSHGQMYQMLQMGIINEQLLDGLFNMIEQFPDYGSEIYVNCRCMIND